ncbi:MAG TPA: GTPase RsgA, partial [Acidimicrobiales bacterium]|nr:GTPase RsgA [Acidimicrobiales bacterium]
MPAASPDALIAYGWSARVAALFHSAASGSDRPGRVIRVERGAAAVVDSAGAEALYPTTAAATATVPAVGDWVVIAGRGLGAVLPRWSSLDRQAVAAVRTDDRRGRHATTSRHLLRLPAGGVVIDTPGLRSVGVTSADRIDEAFPDIDGLAVSPTAPT